MVNITCRVLSRPATNQLPTIYKELGPDYDERVLPSIVNEVLKSVVAQFNASQLITQREMVGPCQSRSTAINSNGFPGVPSCPGAFDKPSNAVQPCLRRCINYTRRILA